MVLPLRPEGVSRATADELPGPASHASGAALSPRHSIWCIMPNSPEHNMDAQIGWGLMGGQCMAACKLPADPSVW